MRLNSTKDWILLGRDRAFSSSNKLPLDAPALHNGRYDTYNYPQMRSWSWETSSFNGAKPLMTFCPKGLNSWAKPPTALPRSLQPPWAKAGPAAAIINV